MAVINPSAIVDAVLADLLANSGLSPNSTWKYAEPRVVMPDSTPLLAVWCESSDYDLLVGAAPLIVYERKHTIVVSWSVANPSEAETGGSGDPAIVAALDVTAEALVARIVSYTSGIPGFGAQVIATLRTRRLAPLAGVIWNARLEFVAEEAS